MVYYMMITNVLKDCGNTWKKQSVIKNAETYENVLSESFMHLPLRPIFRQSHPNFINVRTAYASKIWAQLTKNLLAKSSTKRFREYIVLLQGKSVYIKK